MFNGIWVKTLRFLSLNSKEWMRRQLSDPFVRRAHEKGHRSRAYYKLKEMNDKYRIIKPNNWVLDLGSSPGGWSQVASEIVFKSENRGGRVIAVDLLKMKPLNNVEFIQGDVMDKEILLKIGIESNETPFDVILSDMSHNVTGIKDLDSIKSINLVRQGLVLCDRMLKPNGKYLAKFRQGNELKDLKKEMQKIFKNVNIIRPKSSRGGIELYILGNGYRKEEILNSLKENNSIEE